MADFLKAIPHILQHEGGWVNNKNDPGGATNWGISLRFALQSLMEDSDGDGWADADFDHDGDVDPDDIRIMPREAAITIYRVHFWETFGYDRIADQMVATKVFDMCVNMGSKQAHKIVQRALGITDDGLLGKITLGSINRSNPETLLKAICSHQAAFYLNLIVQKPRLAEFKRGWLRRAGWPLEK